MESKQGDAPVLTELNVIIEETESVHPEELGEMKTSPLFLSNIDMVDVQTCVDSVHIYSANPQIQPSETCNVADRIKKGLSKTLVHYDIFAGRLRVNEESNRLELHRNYAGVPFSTASCHAHTLEDLGDLSTPKPFFSFFLPPPQNATKTSNIPLLMQVTTFKCGGFVLGVTASHALVDGVGIGGLLINILSLAQEGPLVITPQFDRTMLIARETPQDYPDYADHAEFWNLPGAEEDQDRDRICERDYHQLNIPDLNPLMNTMVSQFFSFSAGDLVALQHRATEGGVVSIASRFDALTSHIWKAYTMANESDPTRVSRLVFAVDFRNLIEPPLPKGFAGNATVSAFASATCQEIREKPLSFCVELIQKAKKRVTNDYVRYEIDYLQKNVGKKSIEPDHISLTTWAKLPFHSIEFDGKLPLYAGPTLRTCPKEIIIFPSFESSNPDGFNLLLTMSVDAMGKFWKYVKVSDSMIETTLHQFKPESKL